MEDRTKNTPLMKLIIQMSVPAVFSLLISALYNFIDSIFVAQLGEYALTAVSLAFPIQTLIIAVGVGTGTGLGTMISIKLGEKDKDYANEIANYTITIGIIIGLIFAFLGAFFAKPFFNLFTDDPLVFQSGVEYTMIITIFSMASAIQLMIEKTIQATGDMILPMFIVLIGAITNIILDPILIFGYFGAPALGVKGAAIATVTGQFLAMSLGLFFFYKKDHGLAIGRPIFKLKRDKMKNIMSVGFPAIMMQALSSALIFILNAVVAIYSETAVSVLGIYFKLQQFIYMPIFGISQGVRPIKSFFFGAQEKWKLKDTFKKANILTGTIMLIGSSIFIIFAPQIIKVFNPSVEMLEMGVQALRIISTSFLFAGINIMYSTLFQSIGEGRLGFTVSFLREFLIIVPLALVFGRFFGLIGIWFSFLIAETITLLLTHFFLLNYSSMKSVF